MKIAEDDEERKIKLEIEKYYKYMLHQKDDSPLYMFQSGFNELEGTTDIVKDYQVPKYFQEDFFGYVSWADSDERRQAASLQMVPDRSQALGHHSAHRPADDVSLEHFAERPQAVGDVSLELSEVGRKRQECQA